MITHVFPNEKVMHKIFRVILRETIAYFSEIFFPCDLHSFSLLAIKPLDVNHRDSDKDTTFSLLSLHWIPKMGSIF